MLRVFVLAVVCGAAAFAQPVVAPGGVTNGASYIARPGIAQGSLFVVQGENLGPDSLQISSIPRPDELETTRIEVTVSGVSSFALIYYTSATQVAGILPSTTPVGEGTLQVHYQGQTSAPVPVVVVRSALGVFTWNQAGSGPAIVQNHVLGAAPPLNSISSAANPGQALIVWATGLGPIEGSDGDLPPVGDLDVNVEVYVGGVKAVVFYRGRSPQFPGVDQINLFVPEGIAGCNVTLEIYVDGVAANTTTISIVAAGQVCSDTLNFTAAQVEQLVQDNGARFGRVYMEAIRGRIDIGEGTKGVVQDALFGFFVQRSLAQIQASPSLRGTPQPSFGSCVVSVYPDGGSLFAIPPDPVAIRHLEPGNQLRTTGPRGLRVVGRVPGGPFAGVVDGGFDLPDWQSVYFVPGHYTTRAEPIGADFTERIVVDSDILEAVTWTNADALGDIDRNQDLTITWEGGDPAKEFVWVSGTSRSVERGVITRFHCTAEVSAGTLTIPVRIVKQMTPSSERPAEGISNGMLFVASELLPAAAAVDVNGLAFTQGYYANLTIRDVMFR